MLSENNNFLVGLVGCIGNDEYGKIIKKELESVGVSTDFVELNKDELTSRCGCGILKKERCFIFKIFSFKRSFFNNLLPVESLRFDCVFSKASNHW